MSSSSADVAIVGGGLAGLRCALHLSEAGLRPLVLEAAGEVGGRMRTERVDGFLLDRGFQVFLTAYPEAKAVLDYRALGLRPFRPGALVHIGDRFVRVGDPLRRPRDLWATLRAPVGTIADKVRLLGLRRAARSGDPGLAGGRTTDAFLRARGFSTTMIDRLFRPWFGGVFLDRGLEAAAALFLFYFGMFARGPVALPANGIGAIPRQIADRLPPGTVRIGAPVAAVAPGVVRLEDGGEARAPAVVVATEGPAAARLLGLPAPPDGPSVTCHYFAAPEPPVRGPWLVLNGDGDGPVNDLAVVSEVAPTYAPPGQSLVAASVPRPWTGGGDREAEVRDQMGRWFGAERVARWRHLKTCVIRDALPRQRPEDFEHERSPRFAPGLYLCGDHRTNGSQQGALESGRHAAEAVLEDLRR